MRNVALPLAICGLTIALIVATGCRGGRSRTADDAVEVTTASTAATSLASDPTNALRIANPNELPLFFDDGDRIALGQALEHSRRWYARRPAEQGFVLGPRQVSARDMAIALDRLSSWLAVGLTPEQLAAEVIHAFDIFTSVGGADGGVLVTGYYEPILDASLRRSADYQVPIYGPPGGMVRVDLGDFAADLSGRRLVGRLRGNRLIPWPMRGELRRGGELAGREIAWARDPIDVFFLEIQGSGTLRLEGGGELRIGYAASNGRAYRSIGRLLIDEGKIEPAKMSMQAIRAYLSAHPEEIERVFDHNESTVFFRRLDGPPVGSLGFPVTPGRSIATDRRLFPHAALAFLETEVPAMAADGSTVAEEPLHRFVFNQDTGGAIRGPGRVDFFWGRGQQAGYRAGLMKQPGRLFFLVPKV